MSVNIEVKAKLNDIESTRQTVEKISDQPVKVIIQQDTFFTTSVGRLKLREFADGTGELIYYLREDKPDPTGSTYQITPTNDPAGLREVLRDALGIRGEVSKTRQLYMKGRTRIHLDTVSGLGEYLELEVVLSEGEDHSVGVEEADEILNLLSIREEQYVHSAYIDLLESTV